MIYKRALAEFLLTPSNGGGRNLNRISTRQIDSGRRNNYYCSTESQLFRRRFVRKPIEILQLQTRRKKQQPLHQTNPPSWTPDCVQFHHKATQ